MNPLNHFGIQKRSIRSDTKSYNREVDWDDPEFDVRGDTLYMNGMPLTKEEAAYARKKYAL